MHLELDYEALIMQDSQSSRPCLSEIMYYNPAVVRHSEQAAEILDI